MQFAKISKKNGKYRNICIPDSAEKAELRDLLEHHDFFKYEFKEEVQGFVKGRSIVTNAKKHIGFRFTLEIDLENFFESITCDKCKVWTNQIPEICFVNKIAMQGLPTSPFISNYISQSIDTMIKSRLTVFFDQIVYTRYADDIFVSFNDVKNVDLVPSVVQKAIWDSGFTINQTKTRLLDAKNGRRVICGISVGENNIRIPRKIRHRLRAAKHQENEPQIRGLTEFCKLKEPNKLTIEKGRWYSYKEGKAIFVRKRGFFYFIKVNKRWKMIDKFKYGLIPMQEARELGLIRRRKKVV